LDAKYDAVDGSSDEVLSITPKRKATWVRMEADIHPLRGNGLTQLVREYIPRIWFLILKHYI
jgi:hypothetical protein